MKVKSYYADTQKFLGFWVSRQDCQIECWTKPRTVAAASPSRGTGQLKKVQQIHSTFHAFAAILENGSVVCGFQCTEMIGWYVFWFGISSVNLTQQKLLNSFTQRTRKLWPLNGGNLACQRWQPETTCQTCWVFHRIYQHSLLSLFHITCFICKGNTCSLGCHPAMFTSNFHTSGSLGRFFFF